MSSVSNVVQLRQRYQLKVVLSHIKPPIWRRLVVDSRIPMDFLHDAIQLSFGWDDYHMHQFIDRKGVVYGEIPEDDFISLPGQRVLDESDILLNEVLNEEKDWLTYEYDFGDGWSHKIILEKILAHEKNQFPVVCIKGKRACPPEDCGGPWGYENLLEQLKNPGNEEYDELVEWLEEDFDSEQCVLPDINELLQDAFEDVIFNAKPGLENALKRLESGADETDFLPGNLHKDDVDFNDLFIDGPEVQGMNPGIDEMVRELMDDKALPEEIKELLDGMQQMVGMLAYMEELLEQSADAFEQIRMLSKDKKVISIADKMLMTLDDE